MSLPSQFSIAPQTLDRVAGALVGLAVGSRRWVRGEVSPQGESVVDFALSVSAALNERANLPAASTAEELFAAAVVCGAHFPAFEASAARALHSVGVGEDSAQFKDQAAECAGIVSAAVHKGPDGVPAVIRSLRAQARQQSDAPRGALMSAYSATIAAFDSEIGYESFAGVLDTAEENHLSYMLHAALFGAFRGVSAFPTEEHVRVGTDKLAVLVRSGVLGARSRQPDSIGWPTASDLTSEYENNFDLHDDLVTIALPEDVSGVLTAGSIKSIPAAIESGAQVVVSLCRVGVDQVPIEADHAQVWLTDSEEYDVDPNLPFVLTDTSRYIAARLASGDRVHVHCVEGRSRTATVAALTLAHLGVEPESCASAVEADLYWANPAARLVATRDSLLAEWGMYRRLPRANSLDPAPEAQSDVDFEAGGESVDEEVQADLGTEMTDLASDESLD